MTTALLTLAAASPSAILAIALWEGREVPQDSLRCTCCYRPTPRGEGWYVGARRLCRRCFHSI